MSTNINLLRQKKLGFFSPERLLLFSKVGAIVSLVLVVSLSIIFFFLSRDPTINTIKKQESDALAQLTLVHDKTAKYLIIVDRVNKLKALIKTQLALDTTLSTIQSQIPSNLSVTSFSLDKKTFSLSVASSDLSLVGTCIDNFTKLVLSKKMVKSITIQSLITDEKSGVYVLSISGDFL